MESRHETIRKMVGYLNNRSKDGGFWLPNIQRRFVWSEEQIERLFDSILREYPISTLLVWKTNSTIRYRKFIDNYQHALPLGGYFEPEDSNPKMLVLDGQQRLQSLFIGLRGSYEKKELFFDVLSGTVAAPDDIKYRFKFLDPAAAKFPWMKFKALVASQEKTSEAKNRIVAQFAAEGAPLDAAQQSRIEQNVEQVFETFRNRETMAYQELDSIDRPSLYGDDDIVEIFIRANSGGTKLGKSELLFSLLSSSWDQANDSMEDLLNKLNAHGYAFTRDFVLKTCLTVLDRGARYEISKLRTEDTRARIEERWEEIAEAICDVADFLRSKTFMRGDKALPSYLVLIPLIYARFHFKDAWMNARDKDAYLARTLLCGAFSGTPDTVIDAAVAKIREERDFVVASQYDVLRHYNRSLEITPERLLSQGYGSDNIHLLFNWWYRDFNYDPAFEDSLPQVDHIFPQSLLKRQRVADPQTGKKTVMRYKAPTRDQLANCMLLTREENGAGGKRDTPPERWFADKDDDYLKRHMVPLDRSLFAPDRFDDFVAARKQKLLECFAPLLRAAVN